MNPLEKPTDEFAALRLACEQTLEMCQPSQVVRLAQLYVNDTGATWSSSSVEEKLQEFFHTLPGMSDVQTTLKEISMDFLKGPLKRLQNDPFYNRMYNVTYGNNAYLDYHKERKVREYHSLFVTALAGLMQRESSDSDDDIRAAAEIADQEPMSSILDIMAGTYQLANRILDITRLAYIVGR